MNRPFRIGIVGLGVISQFYAAALRTQPGVELAGVCDLREAALDPYRGQVSCFADHRMMFSEAGLDAVVVTAPNDVHAEICTDAVLSGLPVCVEKPLSTSVADARGLDALARRSGIPLFTAFHRRYNQNVRALGMGAVDSMRVRYLERIEEHIGDEKWYLDAGRCGGGCVADNGPNAFDLVRRFLGDVEVTCSRIFRDVRGTDRQARIELRGANGRRGVVELDWSHAGETKDVELHMADGTNRYADMLDGHPEFKQSLWHEYVGVVAEFTRHLATRTLPEPDGLAAVELVEACYSAERAGRTRLEQL